MTETSFQEARKIMAKANNLRSMITVAENAVSKWTRITEEHKTKGHKHDGTEALLNKAVERLYKYRSDFSKLDFPPSNMSNVKVEHVQCEECGATIAKGNTYCGECLCED